MSLRQPLGITFIVPDGQEATGVYEDENGIAVFETDEPYLLDDGKSLQPPLPVKIVSGPIFTDSMGNAQSALAIMGLIIPPVEGAMWDNNTTWDNNTFWS